jgi:hypothetical protein
MHRIRIVAARDAVFLCKLHIPAMEMLGQVHARYHSMKTAEDMSRVIWQALCARGGAAGMVGSMRSGMVSVLLGLAYSDTSFDDVSHKWSALAAPTSYMRSTEALRMQGGRCEC